MRTNTERHGFSPKFFVLNEPSIVIRRLDRRIYNYWKTCSGLADQVGE